MADFAIDFRIASVEVLEGEPILRLDGERGISGETTFERFDDSISIVPST